MKSNIHIIILIFLIFILFPVIFNIVELNNIEHFDGSGSLINIPENEIINNNMINNEINGMSNNPFLNNGMPNNENLNNGMSNNPFNGMPNNQFNGMPNNHFNCMNPNQFNCMNPTQFLNNGMHPNQFFNPHPFKSKLEDIDNRLEDIQKKIN
jgi:hypothetical protein